MMRIFITTLAFAFAASVSAQTAEPLSAEAKAGIENALAEIGCTPGDDTGPEGSGYDAGSATCKDGKYDIKLDRDFKIIEKKKI
jgi:hypothetical protein